MSEKTLPGKDAGQLLKDLREKYPDVGLSYGYIGNWESWGDERSWYFFTKVGMPDGRDSFKWGGFRTVDTPAMLEKAWQDLEDWIRVKVLPHIRHRWRTFKITGRDLTQVADYLNLRYGCKFGVQGYRILLFSLQYITLEDLTKELETHFSGQVECVSEEND